MGSNENSIKDATRVFQTHIDNIKTQCKLIKRDICTSIKKDNIDNITPIDIKNCSKLLKETVSDYLLSLVNLSNTLCQCEYVCKHVNKPSVSNCKHSDKSLELQNINLSIKNLNEVSETICQKLNNIDIQKTNDVCKSIKSQLDSLSSSINCFNSVRHNESATSTKSTAEIEINTPEPAIKKSVDDFINTEESTELYDFLSKLEYRHENGHDVKNFGEKYDYNGGADKASEPIPPIITKYIDKIKELNPGININECLINRYDNGESFLSRHSDDELSIDPESSIFCLSLGQDRGIVYKNKFSGDEETYAAKDRSLYIMTRTSQAYYSHRIDPENCSGTRYSLTFRHVGRVFTHSTVVIGDSNTKYFKFGEGMGTFGVSLPGKRIKAAMVEDINPHDCAAYANVVLVVGTNNLRSKYISNKDDVSKVATTFNNKISIIQKLRKDIKIIVIPVLPTRLSTMNQHIVCYNKMLHQQYVAACNNFNVRLPGLYEFLDGEYLLRRDYTRANDPIHLNGLGLSCLASLIKNTIFNRSVGHIKKNSSGGINGRSSSGGRSHPS